GSRDPQGVGVVARDVKPFRFQLRLGVESGHQHDCPPYFSRFGKTTLFSAQCQCSRKSFSLMVAWVPASEPGPDRPHGSRTCTTSPSSPSTITAWTVPRSVFNEAIHGS